VPPRASIPDIDIELIASTERSEPSPCTTRDIAFRTTNQPPANVVASTIADFAYAVYATQRTVRNSSSRAAQGQP